MAPRGARAEAISPCLCALRASSRLGARNTLGMSGEGEGGLVEASSEVRGRTDATTVRRDGWPMLVERDGEREVIEAALAGAREGHGRLVLLYGQSGIGRSSLLRA